MSTVKLLFRVILLSFLFLMYGCVKDVDFDQVEEITIPPTAAIDLVYFSLTPSDFSEKPSSFPTSDRLIADDEVRLGFLDDDYIRNGLVRAEFNFIYTNSFKQGFHNTILFLSENNTEKYRIEFDIPPGDPGNPNIINYTEIIDADEVKAVKESIKMRVEIEMMLNNEIIEGDLQLKSKAFYKFEFQ